MKKRILAALLAMVMVFSLLPAAAAAAESGSCGSGVSWKLENGTLTVSGGGAITSDPWNPEHRTNITAVVIEEGVTAIPGGAFSHCDSLEAITLPKSLTTLFRSSFEETFAADIYYGGSEEEWAALIRSMPADPFVTVTGLDGNVHYGGGTAPEPENFTWEVKNGTLTISGSGEMPDYNLNPAPWYGQREFVTSIVIGSGMTNISKNAFQEMVKLKAVSIPGTVTRIGELAFAYSGDKLEVDIPGSVKTMEYGAFLGGGAVRVTLHEGTKELGNGVFGRCGELAEIYLPASVERESRELFDGSFRLKHIYYAGSEGQFVQRFPGLREQIAGGAFPQGLTVHYNTPAGGRPPKPTVGGFTDVFEGDYYADSVKWAVENKITNGTSPTTFGPGKSCTRGQIVTFLWNAAGKPEPKSTVNPFADVKSGDYYYKAVLWAVENKITNGVSATSFGPGKSCTRNQAVTFLWNAEGKPSVSGGSTFGDVEKGSYYEEAVKWAVANKITNGTSPTTFGPRKVCTRGQIVTFLYNAK